MTDFEYAKYLALKLLHSGKAFPKASEASLLLAGGILQNNIICGDSLKIMKEWEVE